MGRVNHDVRDAKIKALHASGLSCAAIGRQEGLTRERVRQIVSGKPKPKPAPKTAIAQRRAAAFARLDALAEEFGIRLSIQRLVVLGNTSAGMVRLWRRVSLPTTGRGTNSRF
jgi:hypothetical protein